MIKKFSEFNEISLQKSLSILTNFLSKRFGSKIDSFLFASLVCEYFNLNKLLFISKVEYSQDDKDVIYVYVVVNNKFLDAYGMYNKTDIMNRYKIKSINFDEMTFISSPERLMVKNTMSDKHVQELTDIIKQFSNKIKK